jgi:hypothetical protein
MEPNAVTCAVFLLCAFVPAGVLHTLWLKSAWSHRFAIPLDFAMTFRGRRIFGENKMLRGFMMIPLAAGFSFPIVAKLLPNLWMLSSGHYAALGIWAGLGFMSGELPNSFIKRQLDIAPGSTSESPGRKIAFFLIDRTDSIVGMLVFLRLIVPVPWQTWIYVLSMGIAIHAGFSIAMFRLGIKARPL